MFTPLHALLAFAGWTLLLVTAVISVRSWKVLTGGKQADEFESGVEHGSPIYWRLNRAHINAAENLPVFAAVVLAGHLLGVDSPLFGQLAWAAVAARVCQSACHVASGSALVVTARFAFLVVQLACFAAMGWIAFLAQPTADPGAQGHDCAVEIRSKTRMQAFKGKGAGATREAASAAAWSAACATLPKPDAPHCRDESRFRGSEVVATLVKGDQRSYSATVTVRELAPQFAGEGASNVSAAAACAAAIAAACTSGGAGGDCREAGTFEELKRTSR